MHAYFCNASLKNLLMRNSSLKSLAFALCAILLATGLIAGSPYSFDGSGQVPIKASHVQGDPRTNSILASINGHTLTVTFTENLGNVQIDITTATGGAVSYGHVWTPDSYIAYITNTGSYVVTITLENGDEYYGEFEVTD